MEDLLIVFIFNRANTCHCRSIITTVHWKRTILQKIPDHLFLGTDLWTNVLTDNDRIHTTCRWRSQGLWCPFSLSIDPTKTWDQFHFLPTQSTLLWVVYIPSRIILEEIFKKLNGKLICGLNILYQFQLPFFK